MSSFLDNLQTCIWFDGGDKRNAISSFFAGLLFFTGWWFTIDAHSTHPAAFNGAYHICGIIGTISLFMINSVTTAQMQGDSYSGGCMGPRGVRLWLFIGLILGFAAVIASCWIFFYVFVGKDADSADVWVGIALFLQNLFIFGGSLVYKFGRVEDPWG